MYDIVYESEYSITKKDGGNYFIDYYLPELNIIVEFYGNYWHCNPKQYNSNYYHKVLKKNACDIWKTDNERIINIKKTFDDDVSIIIMWESHSINDVNFLNTINSINENNVTIELF